jgi:hypothetical protein
MTLARKKILETFNFHNTLFSVTLYKVLSLAKGGVVKVTDFKPLDSHRCWFETCQMVQISSFDTRKLSSLYRKVNDFTPMLAH